MDDDARTSASQEDWMTSSAWAGSGHRPQRRGQERHEGGETGRVAVAEGDERLGRAGGQRFRRGHGA